jgi:hypothetical protein
MPIPVKIEYREGWGGASVTASWASASTGLAKQIIPSSRWLVNETGLTLPLAISQAEHAAAAISQVPASYTLALESLPAITASLNVLPSLNSMEWECLRSSAAHLHAEQSIDLIDWQPLNGVPVASPGRDGAYTRFRLVISRPSQGAKYFRLRARP